MHAQLIHCLALAYLVRQNLLRWLQLYPLSTTESESGETMNQHQIADYVQHHENYSRLAHAREHLTSKRELGRPMM
jgi:hypothetical protein